MALLIAVVGVPVLLGAPALFQEAPIRPGEEAPRTVIAPDTIRVMDPEGTERARREAAEAVEPVRVEDDEAVAQIPARVRDAFAAARAVRQVDDDDRRPSRTEQVVALRERLPMLDDDGRTQLVQLSDSQLDAVAREAEAIARDFAIAGIREDRLEDVAGPALQAQLVTREFPGDTAETVVGPIIRSALQPTIREDTQATEAARRAAADEIADVQTTFFAGSPIVQAGVEVTDTQFQALRDRGLEGSEPLRVLLRAFGLALGLTAVVSFYLRAYRPTIWASNRRLVLMAVLFVLFAGSLAVIVSVVPTRISTLHFVLPAGALAMLATILFDPPIGVLTTVPAVALVAFALPGDPHIVAFAALASIASVPLVSRLSARGDLRRAGWQSMIAYAVIAPVVSLVFEEGDPVLAIGAGALSGLLVAVVVMGSLPFLESAFGVVTTTSLLDLADRNHPLMLTLQQKALGSYNHSLMVSTMVERACREIDADGLLGSVSALYHDIGKTRRPYFFIENQFGMPNPHDELDPYDSAAIIKEHVTHGLALAKEHRLPPEVSDGIGCHHGTTQIAYFYRQAVAQAGGDPDAVDEEAFRYPGPKPASREHAVLMLADCCESAARATALSNRNLTREDLEGIVRGLVADRVEDGQLDSSALTFRDLEAVQASFLESLVSVYHPRIAYPDKPKGGKGDKSGKAKAIPAGTGRSKPTIAEDAADTSTDGDGWVPVGSGEDGDGSDGKRAVRPPDGKRSTPARTRARR